MSRRNNQAGFTIVEGLLILIIIGILGFTGWFVWHSKQASDNSLNSAQKSSISTPTKTTVVTDYASCAKAPGSSQLDVYPGVCITKDGKHFTDTTSSQSELVIKEWGIKLVFADVDKVTYTAPEKCSNDSDDPTICVSLELKSSVTNIADCQPLGLGVVQSPTLNEMEATTKLGSFYYGIGGGPGPCNDPDGTNGSINQLRAKIDSQELAKGGVLRTAN